MDSEAGGPAPGHADERTTRQDDRPPALERLGPYRLVRFIARGGMGEVFEAVAVEPSGGVAVGDRVAVKRLLHQLQREPRARHRFRREVELGRKVRHPNLVALLDAGKARDPRGEWHDYLAMELVEGDTLAELLRSGRKYSEPSLRRLALHLARGLEALHGAGAVHRDVKPSNVMLTRDGTVKLVDLGVAHLVDPALWQTRSGAFVGTYLYAAPEQFKSPRTEARSDLYSLGVLLYEAATGKCPFSGPSLNDVERLHAGHVPPKLGRLRREVSLFFEELVATLLQKSADLRFESAGRLVEVLEEGEDSDWWRALAPLVDATGRPGVARRLRVSVQPDESLVGRDQQLESLLERHDRAVEGAGGAFLVEAPAGFGKTRLLAEFVERTAHRDSAVLLGSYRRAAGRQEPQGLGEALVERIGRGRLRPEMARLLPDSPWQAELLERQLDGEPPALADAQSPLAALHAAARAVLQAMARERPLVLLLEDLHHLGEAQGALLEPLVRLAKQERILLVLTRRPDPARADPLSELLARGLVEELPLPPLRRGAVEKLLTRILDSRHRAAEHALAVTRRTRGNPFFVIALARELAEQPTPAAEPPGSVVPRSLREQLLGRVKRLPAEQGELLRAAAVMGSRFDPVELVKVVQGDELKVLQELDRVARSGGLIRSVGQDFEFEHDLLREAIEGDLAESLARLIHGRIAEVHAEEKGLDAAAGSETPSDDAVFLAHHLLHSRRPEQGLPWAAAALEQLYRTSRNDRLLDLASLAIRVEADAGACLRARIRLHQANCLELLGRNPAHHACSKAAVELARECGDEKLELRALSHLAHALRQKGEGRAARELAEEMLKKAEALGEPLQLAWVRGQLAQLHLSDGRENEALELLALAFESLGPSGSDAVRARLGVVHGQALLEAGRAREAREALQEARRLARSVADPRTEASALGNLARVFLRTGDLDAAESRLLEHVRLSSDYGFRQGRLVSTLNLTETSLLRGERERVRRLVQEAMDLDRTEVGIYRHYGRLRLAEVELAEGRTQEALGLIDEVHAAFPELPRSLAPLMREVSLELALAEGRAADATYLLEEERRDGSRPFGRLEAARRLFLRARLAGLERDLPREAELVGEALAKAREAEDPVAVCRASQASGRVLVREGQAEAAVRALGEAAELAARLRLADPGPLPAAYLALLGEGDPAAVAVPSSSPILVRAEAHYVLHRAGAPGEHLQAAKRLLESVCGHFSEADRTRFRLEHPLANAVFEAWRGGC